MRGQHLGKWQRRILKSMRAGAQLYNDTGEWRLVDGSLVSPVRPESAAALVARGYVMAAGRVDDRAGSRTRYALTRLGEGL